MAPRETRAAAAVMAAKKAAKRARRRKRLAEAAATASLFGGRGPLAPPRPPSPPPAGPLPGAVRAVPCLGCALSALAGRSDGECRDVEGGGLTGRIKRCLRYVRGHACKPVPPHAAAPAAALVAGLSSGVGRARQRFLRGALRKALAPPGEGSPSEGSLASSPAASERGEEEEEEGVASRSALLGLRRAAHAAVDAFFDAL
ncbi:hypothetical protein VM1G_07563 [Cytospora mali]|uniref:Uncharacterized protein n=1 Tax=Cytospora mali TaxID=578113 RepID=A0A194W7A8_CYTMA|nr:hypothetical protein VM1G_07563 [Valsa mali]